MNRVAMRMEIDLHDRGGLQYSPGTLCASERRWARPKWGPCLTHG